MNFVESKSSSLRWAIEELSKQKEELSSKLSVAQKREDTNSLIDEVNAQKEALEKRISSLNDGFKASSELVDEPLGLLEEELSKVDDKLEIAQDRLNTLEQEEYLEELGRKLNGDFSEDMKENDMDKNDSTENPYEDPSLIASSSQVIEEVQTSSAEALSTTSSVSTSPTLMKSPTIVLKILLKQTFKHKFPHSREFLMISNLRIVTLSLYKVYINLPKL